MSNPVLALYQHEWLCLQNQSDSYEKYSLQIKLLNVSLTVLLWFGLQASLWTLLTIVILWGQDAIWKTFQARINQRLLALENAIQQALAEQDNQLLLPMQFNQAWLDSRAGSQGLMAEYLSQGVKPTVAYPHLILVFCCIVLCILGVSG